MEVSVDNFRIRLQSEASCEHKKRDLRWFPVRAGGVCLSLAMGASVPRCVAGTHCNYVTKRCECSNEDLLPIGGVCVKRLRSGAGMPCSNGERCVGGAICHWGTCRCPVERRKIGRDCVVEEKTSRQDEGNVGNNCSGREMID